MLVRLLAAAGLVVQLLAAPGVVTGVSSTSVGCATGAATGAAAPASGTLSYAAKQDRYTFQWSTSRGWVGTCRAVAVALDDGTTHRAVLRLTK